MKKLLLLLVGATGFAQSVSLTENTVYPLKGGNCGNGNQTEIIIKGDLNLNGFTLTLRNVSLKIEGNLNGSGTLDECGKTSVLNVSGMIQNSPNIYLQSLSTTNFEIKTDNFGLRYLVYDISGKIIKSGITDIQMLSDLPKNQVLILKVEGFNALKFIK